MRRFLLTVAVLLVLFAIVTAPEQTAASTGRLGTGLETAARNVGAFVFGLAGETPDEAGDSSTGTGRTRAPVTDHPPSSDGTPEMNSK